MMKAIHLVSQSDTSFHCLEAGKSIQAIKVTKHTGIDNNHATMVMDDATTSCGPFGGSTPGLDCVTFDNHDESDESDQSMTDGMRFSVELLLSFDSLNQDVALAQNGYKKICVISQTLQGELIKARHLKSQKFVAIKKVEKELYRNKIAIQDGMSFCVSENILKEALLLKHLTVDNHQYPYLVKFIQIFESGDYYYLVMEYIESETNLKQFIARAHRYIQTEQLRLKSFQKAVKFIIWQIAVTLNWLHHDMNCAHLDLVAENILLKNCDFIQQNDGSYIVNPDIIIKLGDFGVAEIFKGAPECNKTGLSLDNELYLASEVFGELGAAYNAQKSDIFSLGIILFQCMTGQSLYQPMDVCSPDPDQLNGFNALKSNRLKAYLAKEGLLKCFRAKGFDLLTNMLNSDESQRLAATDVIQHAWFSTYYRRYVKRIEQKSAAQKKQLLKQKQKLAQFPYYHLQSE